MNDLIFRDTIEPKSDQLNADDLLSGPRTFTVTGARRGTRDQPVELALKDSRPYRPCKSMRRVLIMAWGDNGKDWVGRSMTLYCDPTVKFGGVAVGGIRISHLSHIERKLDMLLTSTRSKRAPFSVAPLDESEAPANKAYPQADFERYFPQWVEMIASGKTTPQEIIERCQAKGTLSEEQLMMLRES